MSDATTPVPAGWLALREPADERARAAATPLLLRHLGFDAARAPAPLRVVDVGAGTGANLRHLAPALAAVAAVQETPGTSPSPPHPSPSPSPQEWLLLDHDAHLLSRLAERMRLDPPGRAGPAVTAVPRLGDLADLDAVVDGCDLLTCAALLDLLRPDQVGVLVGAVVRAGVPALLALTVTGAVELDPPHPADAVLGAAFDAHQQRGGRLGPGAGGATVQALTDAGCRVLAVPTPWRLGPAEPQLLDAWAAGRAEAAVDQDASLAGAARDWLEARRGQLAAGALRVVVHHVDLAALPPVAPLPTVRPR